MNLAEVREKINEVDAELMALLDKRAECSAKVAAAKLGSGDLIYKPGREREICDKFSDVGRGMGENVIKTVMRNSRLIQYEMYADEGIVPEKFREMMKSAGDGIFSELCKGNDTNAVDGIEKSVSIGIKIGFENENENKLSSTDILLVLAESGFEISSLSVCGNTIKATLLVGEDANKKAYILLFMLYMETVSLEVK
jgi:chorismate mutase